MIPPGHYDPALTAPKDRVRFALGDTDNEALLLSDKTVLAVLAQYALTPGGQPISQDVAERWAALDLARGLIAQCSGGVTSIRTAEGGAITVGNRLGAWQALVTRLEALGTPSQGVGVIRATRGLTSCVGEFGG